MLGAVVASTRGGILREELARCRPQIPWTSPVSNQPLRHATATAKCRFTNCVLENALLDQFAPQADEARRVSALRKTAVLAALAGLLSNKLARPGVHALIVDAVVAPGLG